MKEFVIFWLICSFLTYGIAFADFQGKNINEAFAAEDYRRDMAASIGFGLCFGPLGLLVVFFSTGFAKHGFKIK